MAVSAEIKGLPQLAKNVKKLKKSFGQATLRSGLRAAVKVVAVEARKNAPRDSGDLATQGIGTRVKVQRSGAGFGDVGFFQPYFYGGFKELGTSKQPAEPFLRPAQDTKAADGGILDAFITATNRTITRTLKRVR